MVGAATPKAFIEDMASSGFSENKRLGGWGAQSRGLKTPLVARRAVRDFL